MFDQRQALVCWLAVHALCGAGLLSQLEPGERAAAAKLWESTWEDLGGGPKYASGGGPSPSADARRLSDELSLDRAVEAVSRTPAGCFFASVMAASCAAGVTLATKIIFLGRLSQLESSRLAERLLSFVMLQAVAAAVRPPPHGEAWQWLGRAAVLGYCCMFARLAALRGDALLSSPGASLGQRLRIAALLGGILVQAGGWAAAALRSATAGSAPPGAAAQSLLDGKAFDAALVAVDAGFALARYAVLAVDHYATAAAEARGEEREAWEGRSVLVYWLELGAELALHSLSLAHYLHLWWLHGFQLQLVDGVLFLDVRFTSHAVCRRLGRHAACRRLHRAVRHAFPDATPAQLEAGPCCICLDRMKAGKQLPCSHAMHASCLCAWLEQSRAGAFSCPLCRKVLDVPAPPQHPSRLLHSRHAPAAGSIGGAAPASLCGGTPAAAVAQQQQPQAGAAAARSPGAASRPHTRLQARLVAASVGATGGAAATAAAAGGAALRTRRGRRRIDSTLA